MLRSMLASIVFLQAILPAPAAADVAAQARETQPVQSVPPQSQPGQASASQRPVPPAFMGLPGDKRDKAMVVIGSAMPVLESLDQRIHEKMKELSGLTYMDGMEPEALPRLGLELQQLREELRQAIMQINARLRSEVDVDVSLPVGRGCRSMRSIYCADKEHSASGHGMQGRNDAAGSGDAAAGRSETGGESSGKEEAGKDGAAMAGAPSPAPSPAAAPSSPSDVPAGRDEGASTPSPRASVPGQEGG